MLNKWLNFIQTCIFPPVCLLCGARGHNSRDLCTGCLIELPWNRTGCRRCAIPLPASDNKGSSRICGRCQTTPSPITRTLAPLIYQYPADQLILQLKFAGKLPAARVLGELLGEYVAAAGEPLPDIVVPVPLHRQRLRERGFNQSSELAKAAARRLDLPLVTNLCERTRPTQAQSTLKVQDRHRNVRGAFILRRPLSACHIAIVDDVITTASTVHALARTLETAGATRIDVWSAARASLRN